MTIRPQDYCDGTPALGKPTILCVDDDPDITRSLGMILSNYRVNLFATCCGRQAIAFAAKIDPHLIITDLRMPDGDGQYLLEKLANPVAKPRPAILVLTGQREPAVACRCKALGAAAILRKPVHPKQLLAAVGNLITLHELDAEEPLPSEPC